MAALAISKGLLDSADHKNAENITIQFVSDTGENFSNQLDVPTKVDGIENSIFSNTITQHPTLVSILECAMLTRVQEILC